MPITTSIHIGESINKEEGLNYEGYRDKLDYINHDRTSDNIVLETTFDFSLSRKENLKLALERHVFPDGRTIQDVLNAYNEDKRGDRQKSLDDLLNLTVVQKHKDGRATRQPKIREQSMIVQVGGEENGQIPEHDAVDILTMFYYDYANILSEGKNIITEAYIHLDETTPHLEVHYIPCMLEEKSRGIPINFSPNDCHKAMISPEKLNMLEIEVMQREINNSIKGEDRKNKYERENHKFRKFHETLDDVLIERCRQRGYVIENPKIEGRNHGSQYDHREDRNRREELEKEYQQLQQSLLNKYSLREEEINNISLSLQAQKSELSEYEKELTEREETLLISENKLIEKEADMKEREERLSESYFKKVVDKLEATFETDLKGFKLIEAIAETFTKLKSEIDRLKGEIEKLVYEVSDLRQENRELKERLNDRERNVDNGLFG